MKHTVLIFAVLLLFSMTFTACKSKQFNKSNYAESDTYFSVGQFGGFTNLKQETVFLKNGQVFKLKAFTKEYTEATKIKKQKIRKIITALHAIKIDNNYKEEPGNITYFMNYTLCGKKQSIQWGKNGKEAPAFIAKAYKKIQALTDIGKNQPLKK